MIDDSLAVDPPHECEPPALMEYAHGPVGRMLTVVGDYRWRRENRRERRRRLGLRWWQL